MLIEARGTPPYKVSSGPELPKTDPHYAGREQFSSAETFREAFARIFDLTNAGENLYGQYIKDRTGKVVFTVSDEGDLQLLKKAGKAGLDKNTYT